MTVPIYRPAAHPSDAVLDEEAKILEDEGYYTVAGIYYASQADAAIQRRWEAERRAREQTQRPLICAFCFEQITGQVAVVIAMRPVHPACAKEFDAWISEHPAENDARWSQVTDETPVNFEGEMCRWGELMLADRKVCEMLPDGSLVGGYAI